MKKIIVMHAVIAMCSISFTPDASCQTTMAFIKPEISVADTSTQNDEVLAPGISKENMKNISIRAVRAFIKKFGSAETVTWYKTKSGCVAEFKKDSVQTMAGYNYDGSWNYILKRYAEKKMSPNLRTLVKSTFFDYAIMEIVEITLPHSEDDIIYRVMIKKADNFKVLKICNGEMQIAGDYVRP